MKSKKIATAFLRNTYDILENPEHNSVVSWSESGPGFVIRDQHRFETEILPKYFKHQKYTSFVRQLNMYGFHKHRTDKNENLFKHDQFQKGHLELTEIKRKPQQKKKTPGLSNQHTLCQMAQNSQESGQQSDSVENSMKIEVPMKGNTQERQATSPSRQLPIDNEDEITVQDQNCLKLCELLLRQNRILVKKQQELRDMILHCKKLQILYETDSIETLERLCVISQTEQQNPEQSGANSKSSILSERVSRLTQSQNQQIIMLSDFGRQLDSAVKQLKDTNYFMLSSTSIQGGYSSIGIEENKPQTL